MKRRGFFAVVLLPLLAACGADADSAESPTSSVRAEKGALPVTIEHKYGSTTVEEAPTRIVVAGLKEQDDLLALGEVPIATTQWLDDTPGSIYPWAEKALGDADVPVSLSEDDGIEVERIAALEPDLIIGLYAGFNQDEYDQLSQIAPTIAQPAGVPNYGIGWQQQMLTVGKAIGRPAAAEKIVAGVEDKVADVGKKYPEFAGKEAVFATPYEGTYVYGSADPRSRLLTDLGFTLPPDIDDVIGTSDFGANISAEQTDFLDIDTVVWLTGDFGSKAAVLGNEVYTVLPVHEDGREVFIGDPDNPEYGFSISFVTALSLPYTLDRLAPQLSAAVDGDPATKVPQPAA